jgi:hypothetical protein
MMESIHQAQQALQLIQQHLNDPTHENVRDALYKLDENCTILDTLINQTSNEDVIQRLKSRRDQLRNEACQQGQQLYTLINRLEEIRSLAAAQLTLAPTSQQQQQQQQETTSSDEPLSRG